MSGAQVFDDVAFYYVATSFIGTGVILATLYILNGIWADLKRPQASDATHTTGDAQHDPTAARKKLVSQNNKSKLADIDDLLNINSVEQLNQTIVSPAGSPTSPATSKTGGFSLKNYAKKRYLVLIAFWLLFLYLLSLRGTMTSKHFTSFEPYEILEVPYGSTEAVVKRAYRKLSLKWHPDKWTHGDEAEKKSAESKFMLITKAYNALTDPTTKDNYERYGNPDGAQQGPVSMTYGLPTFLSSKQYEIYILIGYLVLFIMFPLYGLYRLFGTETTTFGKTGLSNETVGWIAQSLSNELTPRQLLEITALAREYREEFKEQSEERVQKGLIQVFPKLSLTQPKHHQIFFILYGYVLYNAYLQGHILPNETMIKDQRFFLSKIGSILSLIADMARQQRVTKVFNSVIDLMQATYQGVWVENFEHQVFAQFSQYLLQSHIDKLKAKNITTLYQFKNFPAAECIKLLGISEEAYAGLIKYINLLPVVQLDAKISIEDDALKASPADIITVEYSIKRIFDDKTFKNSTEIIRFPTQEMKQKAQQISQVKLSKEEIKQNKRKEILKRVDNWELYIDSDKSKRQSKQQQQLAEQEATASGIAIKHNAPEIVSQRFQFKKREIWYLSLTYIRNNQEFLLQSKVIKHFPDSSQPIEDKWLVQLPEEPGLHKYKLTLRCDSYLGCDVTRDLYVEITDPKKEKASKKGAISEKDANSFAKPSDFDEVVDETPGESNPGEDESDEDEELFEEEDDGSNEELPTYWYYLGGSTFLEGVGNLVVLLLLLGVAYYYFHKAPWFKRFVQPYINIAWSHIKPYYQQVMSVLSPVISSVEELLVRFKGETQDLPHHIKMDRAFHTRRGGVF